MADGLFGAMAAVGVRSPRDRWGSITGEELARALLGLALSDQRGVVEANGLR